VVSSASDTARSESACCIREPLDSALSLEQALLCLRGDLRPFALTGEWLGTAAILGSDPLIVAPANADPFCLLDAPEAPVEAGGAIVGGGWVGWLSYGLGARIEQLSPPPPAPVPRAPFSLAFHDHVVVHDGERWWFEALWSPSRAARLKQRLELWRRRLAGEAPAAPGAAICGAFTPAANGAAGHLAAVRQCTERIASGEIYQANICLRLEADFAGDPLELFAGALGAAQPRFGALMDGVISLSPERFLRRRGKTVCTEPIKGTRPRGDGPDRLDELLASTKDRAEHVMIVDLMRNDLGRVCEYGSIGVSELRPEPHAGVWHLVSTVSGRLREGVGDGQLLRATFPPGSVTGAPKVQAMKVIGELEATRRELYTGALGIISPVAGLELSVVIRTFEVGRGRIWLGVGGGIVADSDPEAELDEALAKAAGPLAAIGGRLADGVRGPSEGGKPARARKTARQPQIAGTGIAHGARITGTGITRALEHGDRPDPDAGVFETVLVIDREPIALDEHLARLAGSLVELYGARLDPEAKARSRTTAAASERSRARLRVLAAPDGSITVQLADAGGPADPAAPVALVPYELPGGLGAHKWRDRRLLDALAALVPGAVPLLVDSDGLVLEAAYANVWIREGDSLLTPPADGRILPGVTRAALLRELGGTACEQPITVERLAAADHVMLSSSISGWRRARLADGS
jgi:para-aminobenzoate synthetase/4-amino-4-deoxychorismate lyase